MLLDEMNDKVFKERIRSSSAYRPLIECMKNRLGETYKIGEGYTYKEYAEYFKSGSRKEFEIKYFRLYRWRLTTSAVLYFVYGTDKYYDILVETIWDICNEYSWCLPNHSEDEADEQSVFDCIDLFAAETGLAMAEILYLFKDKLPARLVRRVKFEIDRRIFQSVERRSFYWEEAHNNWAAVCAGAVGMTYIYENPQGFAQVKGRILSALDCFLAGFSDEGVCFEGLGYWSYGFGYYIYFAELLYDFTNGKEDILHRDLVEKIACFQQKMFIGGSIVSFSDCGRSATYPPGLTCYLAKTFERVHIPANAQPKWMADGGSLCPSIRNLLWFDENIPVQSETGIDYMESAGWYISRKKDFCFAAKAGNNDEPHNHNDIGSFIIADKKNQVLADYGCGEYTQEYFMPQTRYLNLCNSSRGHSVPEIDGIAQECGMQFRAERVSAAESSFFMDISQAYPISSLQKLERKFTVTDSGVVIYDSFEFSDGKRHSICERFVSMRKPEIIGRTVELDGFVLSCTCEPVISTGEVINHTTHQRETLYFVEYTGNFSEFILKIDLKG